MIKNHGTVMLVTRAPEGALHARTMAPAEITADWKFRFIYDRESYKDKEVENEYVFFGLVVYCFSRDRFYFSLGRFFLVV